MELLIEGCLWQPHWQSALRTWQQQGHRWYLLLGKRDERQPRGVSAPWANCPPDGTLSASALLASWLEEGPAAHADPGHQILISASSALLTLAKETGLLTLGPRGADLALGEGDDLAVVLQRLFALRLTIPELCEPVVAFTPTLVLRPLRAEDETEIVRYCGDEALARYTLTIPHPYSLENARDWLAMSGRKAALGVGWSWALTLPAGQASAPLLGIISLHWSGELAWWVGVPWQNQGLATRAARLVRAFAFERLYLPALSGRHLPDNLASGRVMAKLGMHYCGRLSGTERQPCELNHWRLDRSLPLPGGIRARLQPWLEDKEVAVAILHGAWARGDCDAVLELALFMADARSGSERGRQDGVELLARRYPLALLEGEEWLHWAHRGGLLLKERGALGLAYLLRLSRGQGSGDSSVFA